MALSRPLSRPLSRRAYRTLSGGVDDFSLLQSFPGASAAYSLQDINGQVGNVVRVRRSSDNAERNFTANGVTDGELISFCGAGDGFVTTLYDQSGSGNDATQTTAASQPQIVDSGALVTDSNGNPSLDFDGVDDFLENSASIALTSQSTFILSEIDYTAPAFCGGFSQSDSNEDFSRADLHIPLLRNGSNNQVQVFDGGTIASFSPTDQTLFLTTAIHSGSLLSPFFNGAAGSTGSVTLNFSITRQRIGDRCSNITTPWKGRISEIIDFANVDQTANRAAIEANIANRYGITLS